MPVMFLVIALIIFAIYGGIALNPVIWLALILAAFLFWGGPYRGYRAGRGWW